MSEWKTGYKQVDILAEKLESEGMDPEDIRVAVEDYVGRLDTSKRKWYSSYNSMKQNLKKEQPGAIFVNNPDFQKYMEVLKRENQEIYEELSKLMGVGSITLNEMCNEILEASKKRRPKNGRGGEV